MPVAEVGASPCEGLSASLEDRVLGAQGPPVKDTGRAACVSRRKLFLA